MEIIWHGTASVEIITTSGRLIVDPFVPLKGSTVPVKLEDFDGFSDILLTHGHLDHIASIKDIIKRNPFATVYCTATPYRTLTRKRVPTENLSLIEYGQTLDIQDFTVTVCRGKHAVPPKLNFKWIMSMLASKTRGNLPYIIRENRKDKENDETTLFVVEAEGKRVIIMGSMNLRDEIDYPIGCDALILPYNGWPDNLPPAERIIERLSPKRVLLDHYDDTFPPLCIEVDPVPVINRFGDNVTALKHNEKIVI